MAEILARLENQIEGEDRGKERRKQIKTLQTFLRLGHNRENIEHYMKLSESELNSLLIDIDEGMLEEAWWAK